MRIDYYTLHFRLITTEALERIGIVFEEYLEKDGSIKPNEVSHILLKESFLLRVL